MSVYQYVADNNPRGTQQLIESFGYEITDRRDLGRSLSELVSTIGEPALKKVMDIHPDKDIIVEYNVSLSPSSSTCGCSSCKAKEQHNNYMNASGEDNLASNSTNQPQNNTHLIANQTNVILVVATLFIVSALILKK
jgi:hypothetical protein